MPGFLMVEKLIINGLVAVIISPGYGAGWSTWDTQYGQELAFDKDIAQAIIQGDQDKITNIINHKYPETDYNTINQHLVVEWVPQGSQFQIHEYDGSESIRYLKDMNILTT